MKKIAILFGLVLLVAVLALVVYRFWPDGQTVRVVETDENVIPTDGPAGMVWVAGGQFEMGSDEAEATDEEKPAHPVKVDGFWMMDHEITNKEFSDFVKATKYVAEAKTGIVTQANGTENLPVTNVTWNDAVNYCAWAGMRLPSEAEWEFAAKGTTNKKEKPNHIWEGNFANTTVVAGKKYKANQVALFDMAGNVWEWCGDWFDPVYHKQFGKAVVQNNLQGPNKQIDTTKKGLKQRVQKGGSFLTTSADAAFKRATARRGAHPDKGLPDAGFRPVMSKAMWEAKKMLEKM